jgi:hypothetical protein
VKGPKSLFFFTLVLSHSFTLTLEGEESGGGCGRKEKKEETADDKD